MMIRTAVAGLALIAVASLAACSSSGGAGPSSAAAPSLPSDVVSAPTEVATTPVSAPTTPGRAPRNLANGTINQDFNSATCADWNVTDAFMKPLIAGYFAAELGSLDTSDAFSAQFAKAISVVCKSYTTDTLGEVARTLAKLDTSDFPQ